MVNHQYCEYHSHVEATHYRIKVRTLNSVYRPGKGAGVSSEGFLVLKHCSKALLMIIWGYTLLYFYHIITHNHQHIINIYTNHPESYYTLLLYVFYRTQLPNKN